MFRRRVWAFAGGACVVAGFWYGLAQRDPTRLIFLSVGQGDCAVFQSEGTALLIDDGPIKPTFDAGRRIVAPRLRELGISRIDLILLSHPDSDHVGGTAAVLKRFPGARLGISSEFRRFPKMLDDLRKWRVPKDRVLWLRDRQTLKIGAFRLEIGCPRLDPADDNTGSMFVHLVDGNASATFSGDAPAEVERRMESDGEWRAEILKVGHHGSRTATDESWIDAVRPTWAVVSVGRYNVYHHPAPSTLDRLARHGVKILRTDLQGEQVFELRNGHFVHVD